MANIVVYDPADAIVANRVITYIRSGHTPDYQVGNYLINPDVTGLSGIDIKYWKENAGAVVEMIQAEKDAIDDALKQPEIIVSNEQTGVLTTNSRDFIELYSYEPFLDAATYIVQFFAEITNSQSNRKTDWEFVVEDVDVRAEGRYKPDEDDDYTPISCSFAYTNATVDNVKFSVNLLSSRPAGTAKIRRILVTLRKEGA